MSWLKEIVRPKVSTKEKKDIPSSLWIKCEGCKDMLYHQDISDNIGVCPNCGYHMKISSSTRLNYLFDEGTIEYLENPKVKKDPLDFKDLKKYTSRLADAKEKTNSKDALKAFKAKVNSQELVVCYMDFNFMGGSMGTFVGQAIVQATEYATKNKLPLLIISSSGGARMQEGILSLMQMARTTAAIQKLKEAGLPYFVLLTNPTTGGVTASFAMIGDVTLAEPGAVIGFAGKRVIEQTIGEKLPDDFQSAEYLEEKGMVDIICPRAEQKQTIANLIKMLMKR